MQKTIWIGCICALHAMQHSRWIFFDVVVVLSAFAHKMHFFTKAQATTTRAHEHTCILSLEPQTEAENSCDFYKMLCASFLLLFFSSLRNATSKENDDNDDGVWKIHHKLDSTWDIWCTLAMDWDISYRNVSLVLELVAHAMCTMHVWNRRKRTEQSDRKAMPVI